MIVNPRNVRTTAKVLEKETIKVLSFEGLSHFFAKITEIINKSQNKPIKISLSKTSGNITFIDFNKSPSDSDALRFAKATICGISNVGNYEFGMLHFSANVRSSSYDLAKNIAMRFRISIPQKNGYDFKVQQTYSDLSFRMLSFQDTSDGAKGVYSDIEVFNIANDDSISETSGVSITLTPAHTISSGNTFWVEFTTPIFYSYV